MLKYFRLPIRLPRNGTFRTSSRPLSYLSRKNGRSKHDMLWGANYAVQRNIPNHHKRSCIQILYIVHEDYPYTVFLLCIRRTKRILEGVGTKDIHSNKCVG